MVTTPLKTPLFLVLVLLSGLLLKFIGYSAIGNLVLISGTILGSKQPLSDTINSIKSKKFALDYIAILAITTALLTKNFEVALIVVIMMSGGNALEKYASGLASDSLSKLINQLPQKVDVLDGQKRYSLPISSIKVGSTILVRKGEVVPLDGVLLSTSSSFNQSSLTGESLPSTKQKGSLVKSGVTNVGNLISLKTTSTYQDSTYHQIIKLVEEAKNSKTSFTRMADELSGWFTILTVLISAGAYLYSGDITRSLAVLVIATPCPLILAAPIAFIGGISSATKKRIIVKNTQALENLANVKAIVFDKTGTLTFGEPELTSLLVTSKHHTKKEILKIASGLEQNSFHPFAKSIVKVAKNSNITPGHFKSLVETIGNGIKGVYKNSQYSITKNNHNPSQIILYQATKKIATFTFSDQLKPSVFGFLSSLQKQKITPYILTGDSKQKAEEVSRLLPKGIHISAECTPIEKRNLLNSIKKIQMTAMVGDGINDAPALAFSDVGLAFSSQQKTASTEAADIVLVGSDIGLVGSALQISQRTYLIARQSMYTGLLLSLLGMVLAFYGKISPFLGSVTQEVIDVAVILNALRSLTTPKANN